MKKMINSAFHVKAVGDDGIFEGYGSVFDNIDLYGDVVEPGAFAKSLEAHRRKGTMPALLLYHDQQRPCGVYTSISEDRDGLQVRGKLLTDTVDGRDAYLLLKSGALTGLSIGYRPVVEEYDSKNKINRLKEVDLWEISLVTFPANEAARVTAVKTARDFEKLLCRNGFSRNQAKSIACRGFNRAISEGDGLEVEILEQLTKNTETILRSCLL